MIVFILKLIIAHLLGDFALQPTKWIKERNKKGLKSRYLYFHAAVHFGLLFLLLFNELQHYFLGIILIVVSHFLIDALKIYLENKTKLKGFTLFILDQVAHLLIIALVTYIYFPFSINYADLFSIPSLLLGIAILLVVWVSPVIIKIYFSRWDKALTFDDKNLKTESLKNAGMLIGILERTLIVIFINIDFFEGIGFLLAAKSIFRFGDLTNSKEKKLTEYILLGTLISFIIAIIIGLGLKFALLRL